MKAPVSRSFVPAATLAMALLVSACGSDSPDALLASAQDYLSRNDAPAAIIQLKNVLKDRPDSAKARLLLGQALAAPMAMLPPATPCWPPVSPTLRPRHGHKRHDP